MWRFRSKPCLSTATGRLPSPGGVADVDDEDGDDDDDGPDAEPNGNGNDDSASPHVRKASSPSFPASDSRAGNGCTNFMGAWHFWRFLQENLHAHEIPVFLGGGFWGGREVRILSLRARGLFLIISMWDEVLVT